MKKLLLTAIVLIISNAVALENDTIPEAGFELQKRFTTPAFRRTEQKLYKAYLDNYRMNQGRVIEEIEGLSKQEVDRINYSYRYVCIDLPYIKENLPETYFLCARYIKCFEKLIKHTNNNNEERMKKAREDLLNEAKSLNDKYYLIDALRRVETKKSNLERQADRQSREIDRLNEQLYKKS